MQEAGAFSKTEIDEHSWKLLVSVVLDSRKWDHENLCQRDLGIKNSAASFQVDVSLHLPVLLKSFLLNLLGLPREEG